MNDGTFTVSLEKAKDLFNAGILFHDSFFIWDATKSFPVRRDRQSNTVLANYSLNVYPAPTLDELIELLPDNCSLLKNNGEYMVSFYGKYTPKFESPIDSLVYFLIEDK